MSAIDDLIETVARLRGPGGCPWDIEQTHQSICDCLIEEVSELLETIDREDYPHMREELGDLLLHVVMHAQMADEKHAFDFEAVAKEVNEKIIRRHPHVFGHVSVSNTDDVMAVWESVKAKEKKNGPESSGVFKHLPPALPSLLFARDVYKQIDKKGLESDSIDRDYIKSLADGLTEQSAGRMLFEIAAACRLSGIDPESALRRHATGVIDSIEKK